MSQNNSPYTQEQRRKISDIIDEIGRQGLYAITISKGKNGSISLVSTREHSNDDLIETLEGKDQGLGDRIIIGTPQQDNPDEYDIVGNIGIRKSDEAPDGVWAISAGHVNPEYNDQLINIAKVMKEPMPNRDISGLEV